MDRRSGDLMIHTVYGGHSKKPIGFVIEHGTRLECVAHQPWLYFGCLDHIGAYWSGEFNADSTPESSVQGWFQ